MRIFAPWDARTVAALNAFQKLGHYHPFTCPNPHDDRDLVATESGWFCRQCGYGQNWAHSGMVDIGMRVSV